MHPVPTPCSYLLMIGESLVVFYLSPGREVCESE